jgi:hypothetical protein
MIFLIFVTSQIVLDNGNIIRFRSAAHNADLKQLFVDDTLPKVFLQQTKQRYIPFIKNDSIRFFRTALNSQGNAHAGVPM